jgi:hypothetical protein
MQEFHFAHFLPVGNGSTIHPLYFRFLSLPVGNLQIFLHLLARLVLGYCVEGRRPGVIAQ